MTLLDLSPCWPLCARSPHCIWDCPNKPQAHRMGDATVSDHTTTSHDEKEEGQEQ